MSKYIWIALALLCTGPLFASNHPAPGGFGISAEYLLLKPSIDDTFFVMHSATPGVLSHIGRRHEADWRWRSGFRVGAVYAFDCTREAEIYYTRLKTNHTRVVSAPAGFLSATVGTPYLDLLFTDYRGTAAASQSLNYQRLDENFTQLVYGDGVTDVRVKFGLEADYIRHRETFIFTRDVASAPITVGTTTIVIPAGTVGVAQHRARTYAIGPQAGFEITYGLYSSPQMGRFAFNFTTAAAILATRTDDTNFAGITAGGGSTTLLECCGRHWRLVPAWHNRIGLDYDIEVSCNSTASIEIGYEFDTYYRGISKPVFTETLSRAHFTEYRNFNLQGLYVQLAYGF